MTDDTIIQLSEDELAQAAGGAAEMPYGNFIEYTVVRGDTLGRIARRFGTTVADIMALNPIIKNRNFIRTGWVLLINDKR